MTTDGKCCSIFFKLAISSSIFLCSRSCSQEVTDVVFMQVVVVFAMIGIFVFFKYLLLGILVCFRINSAMCCIIRTPLLEQKISVILFHGRRSSEAATISIADDRFYKKIN